MLRWLESVLQIAMGLNKSVWFCPSNSNRVNKSDSVLQMAISCPSGGYGVNKSV